MLQFLAEFLGHFHPVIVHLPIGMLLIAAIFHLLAQTTRHQSLRPAVSVSLLAGGFGAVLACITGWLLSATDDYDPDLAGKHQWLGIATAIVSFGVYALERRNSVYRSPAMATMVLMIMFTGHLGGSLTHGGDYLTSAFRNYPATDEVMLPVGNVQEAMVYGDLVRPILEARCYGCHSERKQKGRLRLDNPELMLKGGKSGAAIIPGDPASELIHRILLPDEDEDHMPPKEKPQLTTAQKELLRWWISAGAPFDKKVREMDQGSEMRSVLAALGKTEAEASHISFVPTEAVDAAPEEILSRLREAGAVVVPVAQNSNYLSVNLVNVDATDRSVITTLSSIGSQLVWLKAGAYPVDTEALKMLSQLRALTRLQIGNLRDTGNGLESLAGLKNLRYLNLAGATLSAENIQALKTLSSLSTVYLFGCRISPQTYDDLKQSLPGTTIDTGAYVVPTLAGDTTEVTAAPN